MDGKFGWTGRPGLHWEPVLYGSFVALVIWMFLAGLGEVIGAGQAPAQGAGSSAYWVAAPLVALFFGGLFAARAPSLASRRSAAFHASVVWGLSMLVGSRLHLLSGHAWRHSTALFGSLVAALLGSALLPRELYPEEVSPGVARKRVPAPRKV